MMKITFLKQVHGDITRDSNNLGSNIKSDGKVTFKELIIVSMFERNTH